MVREKQTITRRLAEIAAQYGPRKLARCPTCGKGEDLFIDGDCPDCNPPQTLPTSRGEHECQTH